jgi:hypothetical protein
MSVIWLACVGVVMFVLILLQISTSFLVLGVAEGACGSRSLWVPADLLRRAAALFTAVPLLLLPVPVTYYLAILPYASGTCIWEGWYLGVSLWWICLWTSHVRTGRVVSCMFDDSPLW